MKFSERYYKAELAHLKLAEKGVKKKIKHFRELVSFYRKKRNSIKEIRNLKEQIEGLQWFLKINSHVEEYLEEELKEIENAKIKTKKRTSK
jgi:hypothetical protein